MEENNAINGAEAPETEIGRMNRERMVETTTNMMLADAAQEIVKIAQKWELGDGMSDVNPAMEIADMMLRNCRILKRQHYMNTRRDAPRDQPGKFGLPRAVRMFFEKNLKGADDEF